MSMDTLISGVGFILVLAAVGGLGWIIANELRLRSARRSRLQPAMAGGAPRPAAPGGQLADQALAGIRRLGQQSAVRDPAKLSLLRSRLMQAGYHNREAPVI